MTQIRRELAAAFGLFTRLPTFTSEPPLDFARAVWAYPLAGAAVGLIGALADTLAVHLGMAAALAALWTLAAQMLVTGALHEDGLADTADGCLGGRTPERRLAIMRDSRIGPFGTLALILSTAIRATAITALADPGHVAMALVAAGALARGAIIVGLGAASPARTDGMAAGLGTLPWRQAATGLALALLAALLLGPGRALIATALAVGIACAMGRWTTRRIGGHTGDTLGATALLVECAVLSLP